MKFVTEAERVPELRPRATDMVGMQVRDHHAVEVAQRHAERVRVGLQRGPVRTGAQPGVEEQREAVCSDQVGDSGLAAQPLVKGVTFDQRQYRQAFYLAEVRQPGVQLLDGLFAGPVPSSGVRPASAAVVAAATSRLRVAAITSPSPSVISLCVRAPDYMRLVEAACTGVPAPGSSTVGVAAWVVSGQVHA